MKTEKIIISFVLMGIILNPIFLKLGIPTYWPSLILFFLLILLKHYELLFKPIIFISIIFFIVLFIYDIDSIYSDLKLPLGIFSFFIPFLLVGLFQELIYKDKSFVLSKFSGMISFYCISIMSFLTIIQLIFNETAARNVFVNTENLTVHSFVGFYFLPLFVVTPFLSKGLNTLLFHKSVVLISIIAILMSGFSTAVFVLFLSFGFIVIFKYYNKSILNKIILFFLVSFLVFSYQFIIDFIIQFLPNTLQETKQNEVSLIVFGSVNRFFETFRLGVYFSSWESFMENPIFGNQNLAFGQHSSVLDKLGLFGLFGTLIIFGLYYLLFINSIKIFQEEMQIKYVKFLSVIILIEMFFNPLDIYHTQFFYFYGLILSVCINYITNLKEFCK